MRRLSLSWFHITTRTAFLAAALLGGLVLWYLPNFLELDQFRPQIVDLLESTFHCKALVGNVTGEVFPYPGLVVGHVVLLENSAQPRVLASVNSVHLWFSAKTFFTGRLRFSTIRFARPRIIIHHEKMKAGTLGWTFLTLPGAAPSAAASSAAPAVTSWEIRNGTLELWDHTATPTAKWVVSQVNGSFQADKQTAALAGKILPFGRHALLDIHYNGAAAFPIQAHLEEVSLESLQNLWNMNVPALEGSGRFFIKVRLAPDLAFQAVLEPLHLARLGDASLRGEAFFEKNHLSAHFQTAAATPLTLHLEGDFAKAGWKLESALEGYDAALVKDLYQQTWVNRLEGPGTIYATGQSGAGPEGWSWQAEGKNFELKGTALHLPEWSARGDAKSLSVYAHAVTPEGGIAEVSWSEPADSQESALEVNASSLTIRQVLEVFNLQSKPAETPSQSKDSFNPYAYEPWLIQQGSLQAAIHSGQSLEIKDGDFDIAGMHLDFTGSFDLTQTNPKARVEGDVQHLDVAPVVESFFDPPSPVTGTGQLNFALTFPLSDQWMQGLNGSLGVEIDKGILRMLKNFYRIVSVLNLGNYLRLRFPNVVAQGIIFENITGHLTFQNGVLSSDDLFLKSPNMNIGAKGELDIPGRRVKTTLRVEMFRFLEDILHDVPITHWIFKKPSKIFLPLVVSVEGPWDNVDVR